MNKLILIIEGKPEVSKFDKSFYTESHDVPAIYIGDQIVAIGSGYGSWPDDKDEEHLRWRLDFNKKYRLTIEEV